MIPTTCPFPKPRGLRLPGRPSIPRGRGASRPYRRWAFLAKTPMKSASPSRLRDRTCLRGGHCKSLTTKPPTDNGPMKRPGVFISPGSPRGFRHPGAHTRAPRLNARSQSRSQDRTLATAAAADTMAVAVPGPTRPAEDPDSPLSVADPGTGRAFDLLPRALGPAGPVGCCLQAFLPAWAAITHDRFTLSVIGSGFTIHLNQPLPSQAAP